MNAVWIALLLVAQLAAKDHIVRGFRALETPVFDVNDKVFPVLLAVATGLFASDSIMNARRTQWKDDDALVVICLATGILFGFTAKL